MNQQTACPKCDHKYTNENPPKNLINCQHTICLSCLNNEILCPIDRKRLEKRKYKIQSFQTNQDILDLALKEEGLMESPSRCEESEMICEKVVEEKSKEEQPKEIEAIHQAKIEEEPCEPICPVKEPTPKIQKEEDVYFPKYEDIVFDTCLLHSKNADIICLKDKCLICSNCGLFGQHKNHSLLPYDTFVVNYTALIDQSYNNFQSLKKSQEQIENQAIVNQIDAIIKEKRESEIKYIRKQVAALIVSLKTIEKSLISQIDANLKQKKEKIMKEINLSDLQKKIQEYYREIEKLTQGSVDIFKLENIEKYVDYADENSPKSYIVKEGEYLIAQVDNYSKNLKNKIIDEINEMQCRCCEGLSDIIASSFEFISKNKPKIVAKEKIVPKVASSSQANSSKVNSPIAIKKGKQEDLLINSRSNGKKEDKNVRDMSPIQPIPKFQETFDNTFKHSYKENIITSAKEEYFLKVNEVPFSNGSLYVPQHKKSVSFANNRMLNNQSTRQVQLKRENQLLNPLRNTNKLSSTNSSHIVEREILSVLNENKKKKKLDLPEKYLKHYDDFCKDKVDILDFGGAFLGDQTILTITQLFESRTKLKSAKLMNNKLSDEIFPELINRCRHLSSINLSYNNLTEKSLEWLEKEADRLGSLSNITLSNNKIVLRNVKDRIENLKRKGIKISL